MKKGLNQLIPTIAFSITLPVVPVLANTSFYPGWENDTIKMMAFEGCMFDYGFNMQEQAKEVGRYRKSLSEETIDLDMYIAYEERHPDWKNRYNKAISGMTEVCHQAAKRIDPSIFRIDYTKGGKRGWKMQAVVDIAHRNCLESDPMMTKAKIDSLQLSAGANPYDMKNMQLREERLGGSLFDMPRAIRELGAGSAKCKKLLAGLSHNKTQSVKARKPSTSSAGSSGKDAHTQCLQAKDYEGCMRFQSSEMKAPESGDKCEGNFCIIKTRGADIYGLPKPVGWMSIQEDDGRIFYFSIRHRVPHEGQSTRYVAVKRITRYYQSPKSGSSGTFIGGNSASTNCVGYGGSVNCTTTGSSPTYLPGISATPGGVRSTRFDDVYDCKDNTNAAYKNGKLWIGWKEGRAESGRDWFAKHLKNACDKGAEYIQSLPTLNLDM